MKIDGREVDIAKDYLSPVTYVPPHAKGNAGHKDCEQGVIIRLMEDDEHVGVLYCTGRKVQTTSAGLLVWG